jgi:hypothetical protein
LPSSSDPSGPTPDPNKIVDRLCRTELGLALWRAAVAEETAEMWRARVEQLEQQRSPAVQNSTAAHRGE